MNNKEINPNLEAKVGVVILTYNRKNLLKDALSHLLSQTYHISTIVLIDNCSTDGTDEMLYDCNYIKEKDIKYNSAYKSNTIALDGKPTEIVFARLDHNTGGSGGFNYGLNIAKDLDLDWVWIMDDDAFPEDSALQELMNHASDHNVIGLSSVVKGLSGDVDISHRQRISKGVKITFKSVPLTEYSNITFDYDLYSYVGILLKKNVLHDAGLPIKDYFIFYDDTEHSIRASKLGIIRNINTSIIHHQVGFKNKAVDNSWKRYYQHRNKLLTYYKHFPAYAYMILFVEDALKMVGGFILFKTKYSKTLFRSLRDFIKSKNTIK